MSVRACPSLLILPPAALCQQYRVAESARQERAQGGGSQARESGDPTLSGGAAAQNHPENQKEAAQATWNNHLTTGHSAPDDGDADNAKR
jgi:hypothetical protein